MRSTNARADIRSRCGEPSRSSTGRRSTNHEQAIIQAEVGRLVHAIRPFGMLHRDTLARAAGAEHWRKGRLDLALRTAVEQGRLEKRPLDYYCTPHPDR